MRTEAAAEPEVPALLGPQGSEVWGHFHLAPARAGTATCATCRLCGERVGRARGFPAWTRALWRHLRGAHAEPARVEPAARVELAERELRRRERALELLRRQLQREERALAHARSQLRAGLRDPGPRAWAVAPSPPRPPPPGEDPEDGVDCVGARTPP